MHVGYNDRSFCQTYCKETTEGKAPGVTELPLGFGIEGYSAGGGMASKNLRLSSITFLLLRYLG